MRAVRSGAPRNGTSPAIRLAAHHDDERQQAELAALVDMSGRCPDIVMRFGHGPTLPFSARRPEEAAMA